MKIFMLTKGNLIVFDEATLIGLALTYSIFAPLQCSLQNIVSVLHGYTCTCRVLLHQLQVQKLQRRIRQNRRRKKWRSTMKDRRRRSRLRSRSSTASPPRSYQVSPSHTGTGRDDVEGAGLCRSRSSTASPPRSYQVSPSHRGIGGDDLEEGLLCTLYKTQFLLIVLHVHVYPCSTQEVC